jgi:hypothetical protein
MTDFAVYNSLSMHFYTQLEWLEQEYQNPGPEEQIVRTVINLAFVGNALLGVVEASLRMLLVIPAAVIDIGLSFTDPQAAPSFAELNEAKATSFYSKYQFYVLNQFLLTGASVSFSTVKASLDHVGNNFKRLLV